MGHSKKCFYSLLISRLLSGMPCYDARGGGGGGALCCSGSGDGGVESVQQLAKTQHCRDKFY